MAETLGSDDVEVVTGRELIDEAQDAAQASFSGVRTFLLVFALISVLVGTFVIYTSFSFIVAQRQRQVALLRALGAGRGQVLTSVVLESLRGGRRRIAARLRAGRAPGQGAVRGVPPGAVAVVRPAAFVLSASVGTVVTVVSALVPAARASRIPPVAAMRDVAIDRSDRSIGRVVLGVLLGVPGVAAIVAAGAGRSVGGLSPLRLAGVGMLRLFVAMIVAGAARRTPRLDRSRHAPPPAARHRRAPGPAERRPQPQAHGVDGLGA